MENFNSNIKRIRCSLPLIPSNRKILNDSCLIFGFNIEPFSELNEYEIEPLEIIINDEKQNFRYIVKCRSCGCYFNKYFKIFKEVKYSKIKNSNISGFNNELFYKVECNICKEIFNIDCNNSEEEDCLQDNISKTDTVGNYVDNDSENKRDSYFRDVDSKVDLSYKLLDFLTNSQEEDLFNKDSVITSNNKIINNKLKKRKENISELFDATKSNYDINYKSVLLNEANTITTLKHFPSIDYCYQYINISNNNLNIKLYHIFAIDCSNHSIDSGFLNYVSYYQ